MSNACEVGRLRTLVLASERKALLVTSLVEDLMMGNVVSLAREVRETLNGEHSYRYVIVDLSESKYIDSTVLGWLFELKSWAETNDGYTIIVTNVPSHLRVMDITCLTRFLHVTKSGRQALDLVRDLDKE